MKNTQTTTTKFTPRLIAAAMLGAWFAVLFFFSFGQQSVISPELIYTKNLWLFLAIWLGGSLALLLYATISTGFVHIFSLCATLLYTTRAALSGGSYPLTFGLCGVMALMLWLSLPCIKLPTPYPLSRGGQITLTTLIVVLLGGWMMFLGLSSYLSYTTSPTSSTSVYSQMLYHMSQTLAPNTTLEFGSLTSHFGVHLSPIFYVYLPFDMVIPSPATLIVLQTLATLSAVIPLSLIAKHSGLSRGMTCLACLLLCLFPTLIGGVTGGVHEYALALPLLLWLFWSLEQKSGWMTLIFAVLCLCLRETMAVYLFTIGLYWLLTYGVGKDATDKSQHRKTGILLMGASAVYLMIALVVLTYVGKGTLITRFDNVTGVYNTSFLTLIQEIVMNPSVAIYEILTPEKLYFVLFLLLPLGVFPFIIKKRTNAVFLLPLLLLNLLSDFAYHFNPDYPYAFGMTAVLFYLSVCAMAQQQTAKSPAFSVKASVVSAVCLTLIVGSFFASNQSYQLDYVAFEQAEIQQITEVLDTIPADASVSASGRLLPHLTGRHTLHSLSQKVDTDYVVLDLREEWQVVGEIGVSVDAYKEKGYVVVTMVDGVVAVCKKNG